MNKIIPVTSNKTFLFVYRKGKSFVTPYYICYAMKNRLGVRRLGITTGKKVGNSVKRSRCRRIIRVIYRNNYAMLPDGYDFIFVARSGLDEKNAVELATEFGNKAAGFIKKLK